MKRFKWVIVVAAVSVLVAGCGGSSSSTSSKTATGGTTGATVGGKLVIDNVSGSTWTCQFNPFNSAVLGPGITFALVYEPLEFVNILQSGNPPTPLLATSSQWSDNYRTLTFTIRSGVTWSDGTPFSAQDIAYTFNAMKSDKAIDLNALWAADGGPLTSVAVKGTDQVVFTFKAPSQPYFYFVADQTPIVPQHIWSTLNQSKLHSYADSKPVGTGPYLVSNCAPQNIKYLRNPHYWQSTAGHPVPAINEVDYPAFLSNTPGNLFLAQGQAQWGGQYIPNIQSFYVSKDPAHRHYWFPPILNVSLVPNLTNSLLSQLPVRQALAYAIDKSSVSRLGESGYQQPANQTGVVTPTFQSWNDSSLTQPSYDPAKAEQILKSAGFTKGSDGIYKDKSGTPLSFTIKTISGYSDWDASLQIIVQNLKAVGIAATVQDENSSTYTTDVQGGHFQLAYAGSGGVAATPGPSPYYELKGLLFSGNIGSTNFSRYKSASTDALFNQYAAANQSQQLQIIHQIQKVMVDDIPLIPTTEGVDWYQYDTSHISGWPTEASPFAQPSPYSFPDNGVVLTHLSPTG
ncbi:MAG TPA: ABC transporter substrate-binding protein [Solirubrobacteraceae bacterium]|nr:ABC transporter substrate-binding protein [Solirubrobacteraceae bacterium]